MVSFVMKFLNYIFLVLFVCITQAAHSHVIEEIKVVGNKNFSEGAIRAYLNFEVGEEASRTNINQSIKSLYDTSFFKNIEIEPEGPIVYVNVEENPVLRSTSITGNKKLPNSELKAVLLHKPRDIFSEYKSKREIRAIKDVYARKGYVAIKVEPRFTEHGNNVDLEYLITEGEPKFITKINFVGNEKFRDRRLKRVITSKEKSILRILTSSDRYDPDRLEFDKELLKIFYRNKGYLDFEIISDQVESDANGNFQVTFNVMEGVQYVFGTIEVVSELDYPTPAFEKEILTKAGELCSEKKILDTIEKMTDSLGDLGFAFVSINPQIEKNRECGAINLTYVISKSPKIYIDQINIYNNSRTLDKVIRREMKVDEGDPYNASKVKRSVQRIKNLRYFNNVEHRIVPSRDDRLNLEIDVEETSTGGLDFGASFSTAEQGVGGFIQLSERNFLGKGLNTNLKFSKSAKKHNIAFGLSDPYFLGRNLRAGIRIFADESDSGEQSSYTYRSFGTSLSAAYNITEYLSHVLRYSIKEERILDVPSNASVLIKSQEGTNMHSAVGHNLIFNKLDDDYDPKSGYIFALTQDYAGVGGDIKFFKNIFSATGYLTLLEDKLFFKAQVKGGAVEGHSGKSLRINDKFFLGPDDIRGFDVSGIGPRDKNTMEALGGSKFNIIKTELIFPISFGSDFGLRGYIFHDYGALWGGTPDSPNVLQTRNGRASYGYGFSLDTPLGPLVIDWGFPYEKESFDKTKKFRFSYRTPF